LVWGASDERNGGLLFQGRGCGNAPIDQKGLDWPSFFKMDPKGGRMEEDWIWRCCVMDLMLWAETEA
jgi:hypothetical protein